MKFLNEYENWLRARDYSTKTISVYALHIERFLQEYPDPISVKNRDIENYLSDLRRKGVSRSTIELVFYSLQNFFTYLRSHQKNDITIDRQVLRDLLPIRRERKIPRIISNNDLSAILRAPDLKTLRGCRDYCIMLFLLHGLRAAEICALDVDRVFPNGWGVARRIFIDIKGKGRKERRIIMERSGDTEWAWNRYIKMRNGDRSGVAFPAMLGRGKIKRMTPNGLYKLLQRYARRTSVSKIHPHAWRHTTAVRLLEEGIPMREIQIRLGHASIATTEKYLVAAADGQEAAAGSKWISKLKKADARFRRWRTK